MNCKICGAELKRPGEVCNNCMNKLMLEQEEREDNKSIVEVKTKFAIGYEILTHIDSIAIAIFFLIILFSIGGEYVKYSLLAIPIFLIWGVLYLINRKIELMNTKCVFYNTKIVYTYRKIRKKERIIRYQELNEINFDVSYFGKIFNIGTIVIKTNSSNLLKRNIILECVENTPATVEQIQNIIKK